MKKIIAMIALIAAVLTMAVGLTGCSSSKTLTLNVYNWCEYISDCSDDSFNTSAEFGK